MILKKIRKDKKGVSPVIGVILMVAATIVIAAVVIAMLGGFGAPKSQYIVSVTAEQRSVATVLDIYITVQGGPDATSLDYIEADVTDVTGAVTPINNGGTDNPTGWGTADGDATDVVIGTTGKTAGAGIGAGSGDDHVVVRGFFTDGTVQVILDTWV